jgi:DNA polymerase IV
MLRSVLHVDMDAFYASIEQRDHPEMAGKPVIVGGTSGRGVVAAASYEVRRYGVRSAMPMSAALRLCPHAICVPPRMQHYQGVSRQVFSVFHELTPLVEGLSLDEAFLDVTASERLFGDPVTIARQIKRRIRELTRLTASVGVAPNKLVAKIASELEKPDGLTVVPPDRVRDVLDPLPVRRMPGLGRKKGAEVENAGIRTLAELRSAPDRVLWPLFGRYSAQMRARAAGIDDAPVVADLEERSLGAEATFAHDIAVPHQLHTQLSKLVDRVSERLRRKQLVSGCIGVKIRRQDFATFSRQRRVAPPTHDERIIARVAAELLERWLEGHPGAKLRLLGVVLSELSPAWQLGLFERAPHTTRLDAALDEVRTRFGRDSIQRGNTIK